MGNFLSVCGERRRMEREGFCPRGLWGLCCSGFYQVSFTQQQVTQPLTPISLFCPSPHCHFACDTPIFSSSHQPRSLCNRLRPVLRRWSKGRSHSRHIQNSPRGHTGSASEQSRIGKTYMEWPGLNWADGGRCCWERAGKAKTQGSAVASAPPLPTGAELNRPHRATLEISGKRGPHLITFHHTPPILAGKTPGLLTSGRWMPQAPPIQGVPKLLALPFAAAAWETGSKTPPAARNHAVLQAHPTAHGTGSHPDGSWTHPVRDTTQLSG